MKKEQRRTRGIEEYEKETYSYGTRGKSRKRGGGGAVLTVLLVCVLIGIVVFSLSMFFYVNAIEVTGNERYSTNEILSLLNIPAQENMLKIRTSALEQTILKNFHYIGSVKVQKKLPSTIVITVTETRGECQIFAEGSYLKLDRNLKIMEEYSVRIQELPLIWGLSYAGELPGGVLQEENSAKIQALSVIIDGLEKHGILSKIQMIDLRDEFYIEMNYDGKIEVRLGNYSRLEEKIDFLDGVLKKIHESDSGTLDISDTQRASFVSKK